VVAAAVVFQGTPPAGLADSKALSERKREALFRELTEGPHFYAVGFASAQEIDQVNSPASDLPGDAAGGSGPAL